jgi:hypothetical protein
MQPCHISKPRWSFYFGFSCCVQECPAAAAGQHFPPPFTGGSHFPLSVHFPSIPSLPLRRTLPPSISAGTRLCTAAANSHKSHRKWPAGQQQSSRAGQSQKPGWQPTQQAAGNGVMELFALVVVPSLLTGPPRRLMRTAFSAVCSGTGGNWKWAVSQRHCNGNGNAFVARATAAAAALLTDSFSRFFFLLPSWGYF